MLLNECVVLLHNHQWRWSIGARPIVSPDAAPPPVDIPSDIDETNYKLIQTDKSVHVHVSGETPFGRRLHLDLDLAMGRERHEVNVKVELHLL